MQKIVNNFYEKIMSLLKSDKQPITVYPCWIILTSVYQNRFYQCKKIDSIIVKFKHEKAFKFGF